MIKGLQSWCQQNKLNLLTTRSDTNISISFADIHTLGRMPYLVRIREDFYRVVFSPLNSYQDNLRK